MEPKVTHLSPRLAHSKHVDMSKQDEIFCLCLHRMRSGTVFSVACILAALRAQHTITVSISHIREENRLEM